MQRRTAGGGITTTDDFVEHVPGCVSISHPDLTCEQAYILFRKGKFGRTGSRIFRPALTRKAEDGSRS